VCFARRRAGGGVGASDTSIDKCRSLDIAEVTARPRSSRVAKAAGSVISSFKGLRFSEPIA
jgi:hypothetical protein